MNLSESETNVEDKYVRFAKVNIKIKLVLYPSLYVEF